MSKRGEEEKRILCVGSAGVDFVALVSKFPQPDEKIRSSELLVEGGGNAANTACAIGRLGYCPVGLVTSIGTDVHGTTILSGLQQDHVDTRLVQIHPNATSPFTYILSESTHHTRTCIHQPGSHTVTSDFVTQTVLPQLQPPSSYMAVHFDVRQVDASIAIAQHCISHHIPYSVDVEKPRPGLLDLMAHATIILCNSQFCQTALSSGLVVLPTTPTTIPKHYNSKRWNILQNLKTVMTKLAPKAKIIITTLGQDGSCLYLADSSFEEKEKEVTIMEQVTSQYGALWCSSNNNIQVVDTTGAGDAFQGGFLTAYYKTTTEHKNSKKTLAHALRFATHVATQKVQAPGARKGLPTSSDTFLQSEMQQLIQQQQQNIEIVCNAKKQKTTS